MVLKLYEIILLECCKLKLQPCLLFILQSKPRLVNCRPTQNLTLLTPRLWANNIPLPHLIFCHIWIQRTSLVWLCCLCFPSEWDPQFLIAFAWLLEQLPFLSPPREGPSSLFCCTHVFGFPGLKYGKQLLINIPAFLLFRRNNMTEIPTHIRFEKMVFNLKVNGCCWSAGLFTCCGVWLVRPFLSGWWCQLMDSCFLCMFIYLS